MNGLRILLTFLLLGIRGALPLGSHPVKSHQIGAKQHVLIQGITREGAVGIARQHALKKYKSISRFRVVACELSIFWRIILDGGGPEYVIDKQSGKIRRVQYIPQSWAPEPEVDFGRKVGISREDAIEIAKRDVQSVPGTEIERYTVTACELQKVWRVFVEPRLHVEAGAKFPIIPHSHPPNYVIDKKTGKILLKQR